MNSAAQRQLRIAVRKGFVLANNQLQSFDDLVTARDAILNKNLEHLLMALNGKLKEVGAEYVAGRWV